MCESPSAQAGGTAIRLAPGVAQWIATDFSSEMVRIARAKSAGGNLTFVVSDAPNAFEGGPYDAICTFSVLHLVGDLPATDPVHLWKAPFLQGFFERRGSKQVAVICPAC